MKSIYVNLGLYAKDGLINKNEERKIRKIVSSLAKLERIIDMIRESRSLKAKDKRKLEELARRVAEKSLDNLIKRISKMPEKKISEEAKDILIDNFSYVKFHF